MDFAFNASALGVGGVIERGRVITTIPSLASVALAPTGGEGKSVVSNYFSEELKFSHAETRVYGRQFLDDGQPSFTTSTNVVMKDVRIFDKLHIEGMGSTVTSTRGFDGGDDHDFELLLWYRGVRIGRREITPRIDVRLIRLRRYDELLRVLKENRSAAVDADAFSQRFNASPDQLSKLVSERKPVQGSLVESIEGYGPKPVPAKIFVPGLGTVRFGELMLKPGRRRLNLLRINFGAPQVDFEMPNTLMMEEPMGDEFGTGLTGGSMTLGSGEGNGIPIGP